MILFLTVPLSRDFIVLSFFQTGPNLGPKLTQKAKTPRFGVLDGQNLQTGPRPARKLTNWATVSETVSRLSAENSTRNPIETSFKEQTRNGIGTYTFRVVQTTVP